MVDYSSLAPFTHFHPRSVLGNSSFEIEVAAGEAYHYICHFG